MSSTAKRIKRELSKISINKELFTVKNIDDNIYLWTVSFIGPEKSFYKNQKFSLEINFGKDFPFKPPKITFLNKIFHPNIDLKGNICLDLLKENWVPTISIVNILKTILSLLTCPNPDDPLNTDASNLYKNNINEFKKKIEEINIIKNNNKIDGLAGCNGRI